MKLYSWNINGLRAVVNKGALQDFLAKESPDILCLQEIKCKPEQITLDLPDYDIFWNPAERPGYSGTAIFVHKSISVLGADKSSANLLPEIAQTEGRVLTLEFPDFFLVNVYTPNSKPDLSRLSLRHEEWDIAFRDYLKHLEKQKPVITCGDFNAAHKEIDIARPATNHHSAGFTDEEREGITNLLSVGFLDTFRHLFPKSIRYTWWSHWGQARAHNIGWRIDYFFISGSLEKSLQNAEIYEQILGSDHCPISITMEF